MTNVHFSPEVSAFFEELGTIIKADADGYTSGRIAHANCDSKYVVRLFNSSDGREIWAELTRPQQPVIVLNDGNEPVEHVILKVDQGKVACFNETSQIADVRVLADLMWVLFRKSKRNKSRSKPEVIDGQEQQPYQPELH
jgi:hypothetical protein